MTQPSPQATTRPHASGAGETAGPTTVPGASWEAGVDGSSVARQLLTIQNDLFDLGADVATPGGIDGALRIVPAQVERLEREIDAMNAGLPPLGSFILPGGTAAAGAAATASRPPSGRSRSSTRSRT